MGLRTLQEDHEKELIISFQERETGEGLAPRYRSNMFALVSYTHVSLRAFGYTRQSINGGH